MSYDITFKTKHQSEYTPLSFARVPDEEFNNTPHINVPTLKEIVSLIEKCTYKVGMHEFVADIFELSAIAISNRLCMNSEREKQYKMIINKYDKNTRELIVEIFTKIFILLSTQIYNGFDDYLGKLYMISMTSNSKTGQFFTPYNLSRLCAKLNIQKSEINKYIEEDRIIAMHEPTCGAGGMIISAADVLYNECGFNISRNLFVECGDIDRRCVHMTYLQLSLAGIPAIIYHRDGLSLTTWDKWETPAYIMNWPRFKNILGGKNGL